MAVLALEPKRRSSPKELMSSPCELIIVWCPCGAIYRDSWRASINLSLDDFDDDYIERVSSTSCPNCRAKERMGTLLSRFENDHLRLDWPLVPEPLPVILYLDRPAWDQSQTLQWVFDWVGQKSQARVAQLEEIISQRADWERDTHGLYEELSVIASVWREDKNH